MFPCFGTPSAPDPHQARRRKGDSNSLPSISPTWLPDESDDPVYDFGQLDRQKEDSQVIAELLTLVPDYGTRSSNLVRRLAYLDEHMNLLVDGLDKVVLELL